MGSMKIADMVKQPALLNADTLEFLQRMVKRYPYFQTARLLLLQNLFQQKSTLFTKEMSRSAVLLNDRSVLFNMIEGSRYDIEPQSLTKNAHSSSIADEDKTMALIDSFLCSGTDSTTDDLGVTSRPTGNVHVDVTTDYVAYLLQQEGEEDEFHGSTSKMPVKRPSRIRLSEKETYEVPEEQEIQKESFFTETLAKIYIKQHKYDRALEIIRSLCADNPKKNSYFASQIKFLEKLIEINNKK